MKLDSQSEVLTIKFSSPMHNAIAIIANSFQMVKPHIVVSLIQKNFRYAEKILAFLLHEKPAISLYCT